MKIQQKEYKQIPEKQRQKSRSQQRVRPCMRLSGQDTMLIS